MHKKYSWIPTLFLTLLLVVIRLPNLAEPLENDSAANAFFARQMLRGGTLYDEFHPAHHLPGVYYTYEFAFRLFGDNSNAPKLLLWAYMLVSALLLYQMGRIYLDKQVSIVSAVFFILVASQRGLAGMSAEIEQFVNLPLIAGIFLLILLLRRQAPAWQFIWLGVLGTVCIVYKIIFVTPLVVAGISIFLTAWITRKETGTWKTMLFRLIWMAIGLIIPLAIVAGYFASLGLWQRLMLVFELGSNYLNNPGEMGSSNLPRPFGYPFFWMSVNNIAFLFLGLLGTYHLIRRSIPIRDMNHLTDFIAILWLVVSSAIAGMRGGGYQHYVLPVVPPLALMASLEIGGIQQYWKLSSEKVANLARAAGIALVAFLFLWSNSGLYSNYVMYKLSRISHDEFLQNVYGEGFSCQQISNYLKAHTNPNDFIYVWGVYVDVYYYADRLPPIDILWPSYIAATGSPERIFNPHTKYIVIDSAQSLPPWLLDGLAANYELETTLEGRDLYRRKP